MCGMCSLRSDSVIGTYLALTDNRGDLPHSVRRFARKQIVLREGEMPEGLYCVRFGLLKRSVGDPQGNRKIIEILGPGDLVGFESISGNGCRAAEVAALEASELCFLHRRDLPGLAKDAPDFAIALAAYVAERLSRAERKLADLSLKNARQRLTTALLALGRRYGKRTPQGILLDLPIRRGELANLAGVALATASRLCKELKDEGAIRTAGRKMFIVGWSRLEEQDSQET